MYPRADAAKDAVRYTLVKGGDFWKASKARSREVTSSKSSSPTKALASNPNKSSSSKSKSSSSDSSSEKKSEPPRTFRHDWNDGFAIEEVTDGFLESDRNVLASDEFQKAPSDTRMDTNRVFMVGGIYWWMMKRCLRKKYFLMKT